LKGVHHVVNSVRELHERFNQWFTFDNPRFIDRYIEPEIHLIVYVSIDIVDEKFVASFQGEKTVGRADKPFQGGCGGITISIPTSSRASHHVITSTPTRTVGEHDLISTDLRPTTSMNWSKITIRSHATFGTWPVSTPMV
jgi:hypothetical protein